MVQPSGGLRWPVVAAAEIGCCRQVSPPSCETATCRGAAPPLPAPTNAAQHTYTVPKNGLEDALSAQICSLSENVVDDCRLITTGAQPAAPTHHAFLSPLAAARMSSVRETAMASGPRKAASERVAPKFDVRFAKYSRSPLPQLKPFAPGLGPTATAGSPSETRPFSEYQGRVPIGPATGVQLGSPAPTAPRQPRAV